MESAFPAHESIRKRRRWGCTCGCLAFVVAAVLGGLAFFYYVFSPKPASPEERWLEPTANGFAVIRLSQRDEGVSDLTNYILKRVETQQKQGKPENDQKAVAAAMKALRQFIGNFTYPQNYLYLSSTPHGGERSLFVVQLKRNLARLLLQLYAMNARLKPEDVAKKTQLFTFGRSVASSGTLVALAPTSVLAANDPQIMKQALGAAADPKRRGQASEQLQQFIDELSLNQPPEGEDIALAAVNEENRIEETLLKFEERVGATGLTERFLGLLAAQKTGFQDITGVRLSGDIQSADKIKLEITFYSRQTEVAKRFNEAVKQVLAQLALPDAQPGITMKGDSKLRGTSIVTTMDMTGMRAWIDSLIPLAPEAAKPAAEAAKR